MNFFKQTEKGFTFRYDGEQVLLTPWGEDGLRVRATVLSEPKEESIALELPKGFVDRSEITIEDERHAKIRNGRLTAELFVQEWGNLLQITYKNQKGEVLLREIANGGALNLKARQFKTLPGGNFRLKVTFQSNPDEKIYGMGQYQQEIFNLKGCNLELAHRNSQASLPFYISDLGYGFLWHNAAVGEAHFGSNTTEWIANSTKEMDYWLTAGDTPAEIEKSFAACVGTAPMMPEYGLGFWQCKLRYYNQEQVLSVAREYKKRNIPLDVIVIDYYHWRRCGDWRFDPEFFPDPTEMTRTLRDMGIETMVSVWPQVDVRSENYEEMKQQGLLVKSNSGADVQMIFHGNNVFIDPTNPRTREYVWEKCRKNYGACGIGLFWLDEAEPEYATYDYENYRYFAGTVSEIGNIYPREYARLFFEGQQKDGQKEIVNLVRCAWIGSQKYGALVWSGDIWSSFADFRKQICAGIHMGVCGIPWWTTDIGGFHGGNVNDPDFVELLLRWFEFGTFCPVMRLHGLRLPGKGITNSAGEECEWTGADNEVWSYGEEAYKIMVKYIHVREMLRDYTRSCMEEAHKSGMPVMRALFFEFPQDALCWDIGDEYMYGPDILVAPVCREKAKSRKVYLPAGATWVHASTGRAYEGGKGVTVEAEIGSIPVFLRDKKQEYLIGKI